MPMNRSKKSRMTESEKVNSIGRIVLFALFVLLLTSRFMPNPGTALVADDWYNLARSSFYETTSEAAMTGLQDPNRPLSMLAVEMCFRVFGMNSLPWTIISITANITLLFMVSLLGFELTGKKGLALVMGVFFAVTPNLVETYHWSTQVLNEVACALVWYAASAWLWVRHVNRGGITSLLLSVLAYAVALFSYEAGLFLPVAYVAVIRWREGFIKGAFRLSPFAIVVLLYAAWRVTDSFGMNQSWHYPAHMKVGVTVSSIIWNVWQLMHWWMGENLLMCIRNGWDGFWLLAPWTRRLLLLGNAMVVIVLYLCVRFVERDDQSEERSAVPSTRSALLFGVLWVGAAVLPQIVAYTASRLNVLPAIGVGLLVAMALSRVSVRVWYPFLAVPILISLISNQGTTEQFRQAGEMNRRLYAHLVKSRDEWINKDIVVFDTWMIRQRQTEGLLAPVGQGEQVWAQYGNALLFRGFVPRGMIELASNNRACPVTVVHDMENGAINEGDVWLWHERFDPARPRSTPVTNAYYVDVFNVTRDR